VGPPSRPNRRFAPTSLWGRYSSRLVFGRHAAEGQQSAAQQGFGECGAAAALGGGDVEAAGG